MDAAKARRGPPARRTRDEIAAAAVAIADVDGLAAVTLRRLSSDLGTGGGALYRYFSARDELLDLMVDLVTAELPTVSPGTGDPVEDLVAVGRDLLELYRRHRWLADVRQAVTTPGPHVVDHLERCLAVLAPVQAGVRSKMEAIALVTGVVTLFSQQAAGGSTTRLTADSADRWPHLAAALTGAAPESDPRPDLFGRVLTGAIIGILGTSD